MKSSELRSIIKSLVQETIQQKKMLSEGISYDTYVELDYIKIKNPNITDEKANVFRQRMEKATGGSWNGSIEDVKVSIEVEPYYEDNSFDYEYGSERGIHDPGSGYIAEGLEITTEQDVFLSDANGKPDPTKLVLKKGTKIDESMLTPNGKKQLDAEIEEKMKELTRSRPTRGRRGRYNDED